MNFQFKNDRISEFEKEEGKKVPSLLIFNSSIKIGGPRKRH
jgi:hypothetical protein